MPEQTYPYKCTRCGFCCLSKQCPASAEIFGPSTDICPFLVFHKDDIAECRLAVGDVMKHKLGIGRGCCVLARVYKNGVKYDFSSLSPEEKVAIVRQVREGKLILQQGGQQEP